MAWIKTELDLLIAISEVQEQAFNYVCFFFVLFSVHNGLNKHAIPKTDAVTPTSSKYDAKEIIDNNDIKIINNLKLWD